MARSTSQAAAGSRLAAYRRYSRNIVPSVTAHVAKGSVCASNHRRARSWNSWVCQSPARPARCHRAATSWPISFAFDARHISRPERSQAFGDRKTALSGTHRPSRGRHQGPGDFSTVKDLDGFMLPQCTIHNPWITMDLFKCDAVHEDSFSQRGRALKSQLRDGREDSKAAPAGAGKFEIRGA